jgi:hypothetical protein
MLPWSQLMLGDTNRIGRFPGIEAILTDIFLSVSSISFVILLSSLWLCVVFKQTTSEGAMLVSINVVLELLENMVVLQLCFQFCITAFTAILVILLKHFKNS